MSLDGSAVCAMLESLVFTIATRGLASSALSRLIALALEENGTEGMQRCRQILFAIALVLLCWFAMMAIHELGHILGALLTGGRIDRVVLHPLTISRTDVSSSHNPIVVVWLGPIAGCVIPTCLLGVFHSQFSLRAMAQFFAGFCLIANGAYISIGSFSRIGDCAEMYQCGTPHWVMLAFGLTTVPLGFFLWHRLGSPSRFFRNPEAITPRLCYATCLSLVVVIIAGIMLSPP